MLNHSKLTRRNLIKRTPVALAGLFLLGGGMATSASAKDQTTDAKGPPGSCRKWRDKRGDGCCDHSNNCRRTRCPAHEDNEKRKRDAPEGSCALWSDSKEAGICEISTRKERPCPCKTCPSNKRYTPED